MGRDLDALADVPVPLESFLPFDRHFAWDERTAGSAAVTYLGAAVRSFFAQGGRKCYVIRVGDPWPLGAARDARLSGLASLVPGYPSTLTALPGDQSTWRGAGHVFGLPDVSFLCLPDLADLLAVDPPSPKAAPAPPPIAEVFVECSAPAEAPPPEHDVRGLPAPRCDAAGYDAWARALQMTVGMVRSRFLRDLQIVAAIPLPDRDGAVVPRPLPAQGVWTAERDLYSFLLTQGYLTSPQAPAPVRGAPFPAPGSAAFESAFAQLVYPWVRTPLADRLPEGVESPEGVLAGVLARNALARGTFRSAAGLGLGDVRDVFPVLDRADLKAVGSAALGLADRVSVIAPTPSGLRLLSDVTTAPDATYRSGGVSRLISVIWQLARRIGAELSFEPSSERTWALLRQRMERVLSLVWKAGGLRGDREADAFSVRCDRTTMSPDDIDAGRMIAQVVVDPALSVESIEVFLTVADGGAVTLSGEGAT
jgi:hypothetical protein